MSARASIVDTARFFLALAGLLVTGPTAKGQDPIFPKFSVPVLQEDRLIFTSPEAKRLLCVNLEGKKVWERNYDFPIRLFTGPDSEPLLQSGKVVSFISPQSGDLRARFTVEDENDGVAFSKMLGSFVSRDLRFGKRMFKLLDGETGKPHWRSPETEDVICSTPELIICFGAERIPSGEGYKLGKEALEAYDRSKFARKWSVPLSAESGPFLYAAFKSPYLIYVDGQRSLAVLDCTTGRKKLTKQMDLPEFGWISDLKVQGDDVVWLTSKLNLRDFKNTEHTLHFCTIPELREDKTVTLKLIEIAEISFEGGFIISDAAYRTACFRPGGEKLWERRETARTPVINKRIYFSDYDKGMARLGFVEVPTGQETILYREQIKEQK